VFLPCHVVAVHVTSTVTPPAAEVDPTDEIFNRTRLPTACACEKVTVCSTEELSGIVSVPMVVQVKPSKCCTATVSADPEGALAALIRAPVSVRAAYARSDPVTPVVAVAALNWMGTEVTFAFVARVPVAFNVPSVLSSTCRNSLRTVPQLPLSPPTVGNLAINSMIENCMNESQSVFVLDTPGIL